MSRSALLSRSALAFCFVFFGAVLTQACGQADGQVCQIDGDCVSGLMCLCKVGTGARGLCRAPGSTMCSSGNDTGPNLTDAFVSTVDAGRDANVDANVDANIDGNVSLDGGPDTGTDGGTDADTDGGSDAGSDADVDANTDAG